MTIDPATGSLAQDIAGQATRIQALARLMDDAEATRSGNDSGEALILRDIAGQLYTLARRVEAIKVVVMPPIISTR